MLDKMEFNIKGNNRDKEKNYIKKEHFTKKIEWP